MTSKQLSSLLRKTPPATVAAEPLTKPEPIQAAAPEVSREVQLHVLVPAHVRKQVDIMGAHEGLSSTHPGLAWASRDRHPNKRRGNPRWPQARTPQPVRLASLPNSGPLCW